MSDTDVADAAFLLPRMERGELCPPVDQVVHLHQIHTVDAQELHRAAHLGDAGLASAGPHLGGDERLAARIHCRQQIAHNRLRGAIHRRRIDDRTPVVEQDLKDFAQSGRARQGSGPTSKVRHVPQPTTGNGSRVDGIRRVCILSVIAGLARRICDAANAEVALAMRRRNSVRVIAMKKKFNPAD